MGTAWAGKKNKVFTYRYDQPVPGSSTVDHTAEKYVRFRTLRERNEILSYTFDSWMMFLGTSTGYAYSHFLHAHLAFSNGSLAQHERFNDLQPADAYGKSVCG